MELTQRRGYKTSIASTGWTNKIHKGPFGLKGLPKERKTTFEVSKQAIQKEKMTFQTLKRLSLLYIIVATLTQYIVRL
jgi:hypothetical protein